jgi:hypothetical protein
LEDGSEYRSPLQLGLVYTPTAADSGKIAELELESARASTIPPLEIDEVLGDALHAERHMTHPWRWQCGRS